MSNDKIIGKLTHAGWSPAGKTVDVGLKFSGVENPHQLHSILGQIEMFLGSRFLGARVETAALSAEARSRVAEVQEEKGLDDTRLRGSKFEVTQTFSENLDPDKVAKAFAAELQAAGEKLAGIEKMYAESYKKDPEAIASTSRLPLQAVFDALPGSAQLNEGNANLVMDELARLDALITEPSGDEKDEHLIRLVIQNFPDLFGKQIEIPAAAYQKQNTVEVPVTFEVEPAKIEITPPEIRIVPPTATEQLVRTMVDDIKEAQAKRDAQDPFVPFPLDENNFPKDEGQKLEILAAQLKASEHLRTQRDPVPDTIVDDHATDAAIDAFEAGLPKIHTIPEAGAYWKDHQELFTRFPAVKDRARIVLSAHMSVELKVTVEAASGLIRDYLQGSKKPAAEQPVPTAAGPDKAATGPLQKLFLEKLAAEKDPKVGTAVKLACEVTANDKNEVTADAVEKLLLDCLGLHPILADKAALVDHVRGTRFKLFVGAAKKKLAPGA